MINPIEWYKKNMNMYVTSPYGPRYGTYAGFHQGTDLGGISCGAIIRTPFAGRVVAARTSGMGTWGNTVAIEISPNHIQLTAHHQKLLVKEGDIVKQGDSIATNGGTTHTGAVYSCHIHYEIRKNDGKRPWGGAVWGDPEKFLLTQESQLPSNRFNTGDTIKNITNSNIRIRQNPNINSAIVGIITPNQNIKIENHNNNGIKVGDYHWWKISQGWVAEDFFELIIIPPTPIPFGKFKVGDNVKNISAGNVRIRQEPNTISNIVGIVQPGKIVTIAKHNNNGINSNNYNWWFVGEGWIAENFFEQTNDIPAPIVPPVWREPIIKVNLIPEGRDNRPMKRPASTLYGKKANLTYIAIHNTGDFIHEAAWFVYYLNENKTTAEPGNRKAWHFTVDAKEIYQHLPLDETGWHIGDNLGPGNLSTVGIEICQYSDIYLQELANKNAAWLCAKLNKEMSTLKPYPTCLTQHYDWIRSDGTRKNCPAIIRSKPDGWTNFINNVGNFLDSVPDIPIIPIQDIWYKVIAGSYKHQENAIQLRNTLIAQGYNAIIEVRKDE
jgi:hypothetical protein